MLRREQHISHLVPESSDKNGRQGRGKGNQRRKLGLRVYVLGIYNGPEKRHYPYGKRLPEEYLSQSETREPKNLIKDKLEPHEYLWVIEYHVLPEIHAEKPLKSYF